MADDETTGKKQTPVIDTRYGSLFFYDDDFVTKAIARGEPYRLATPEEVAADLERRRREEADRAAAGSKLAAERQVPFVSPDGRLGTVLGKNADKATEAGYRPANAAELKKFYDAETARVYGDAPGAAFVAGALRTISGGASDLGNEERSRNLEKFNPGYTIGGELVGAFNPIGGVAGAPSQFGAAASAGKYVEQAVASKVAAGPGAGILTRAATRAVPIGAGTAVEGAISEFGQAASDINLSKDPKNAEAVLSMVAKRTAAGAGIGAGLGAGLSAVGTLGGQAVREFGEVSSDLAAGAKDRLAQWAGRGADDVLVETLNRADEVLVPRPALVFPDGRVLEGAAEVIPGPPSARLYPDRKGVAVQDLNATGAGKRVAKGTPPQEMAPAPSPPGDTTLSGLAAGPRDYAAARAGIKAEMSDLAKALRGEKGAAKVGQAEAKKLAAEMASEVDGAVKQFREELNKQNFEFYQQHRRGQDLWEGKRIAEEFLPLPADQKKIPVAAQRARLKAGPKADTVQTEARSGDPWGIKEAADRLAEVNARWRKVFKAERVDLPASGAKESAKYAYNVNLTDDEIKSLVRDPAAYALNQEHKAAFLDLVQRIHPTQKYVNQFGGDFLGLSAKLHEVDALASISSKAETPALVEMVQQYDGLAARLDDVSKLAAAKQYIARAEAAGLKATPEQIMAAGNLSSLPAVGSKEDIFLRVEALQESAKRAIVERADAAKAAADAARAEAKAAAGAAKDAERAAAAEAKAAAAEAKAAAAEAAKAAAEAGKKDKGKMLMGAAGALAGEFLLNGMFAPLIGGFVGMRAARIAGMGLRAGRRALKGRILAARAASDAKVAQGVKAFAKGTPGAKAAKVRAPGRSGPVIRSATSALVRSALARGEDGKQPKDPREAAKNVAARIATANADPLKTSKELYDILDDIREADLAMYDQVDGLYRNALTYLAQYAPKPPPPSPFRKQTNWRPGDAEVDDFARRVAVLEEGPGRMVEELAAGRLSLATVEATQAMFPESFEAAKAQLVARLTELRADLPYEKRLLLGTLFGVPVDESQEPKRIAALQATFEAEAAAQEETGGISKADIGSVKLKHDTMETPAQSFAG